MSQLLCDLQTSMFTGHGSGLLPQSGGDRSLPGHGLPGDAAGTHLRLRRTRSSGVSAGAAGHRTQQHQTAAGRRWHQVSHRSAATGSHAHAQGRPGHADQRHRSRTGHAAAR